jgi:hypothetical protein
MEIVLLYYDALEHTQQKMTKDRKKQHHMQYLPVF